MSLSITVSGLMFVFWGQTSWLLLSGATATTQTMLWGHGLLTLWAVSGTTSILSYVNSFQLSFAILTLAVGRDCQPIDV